MQAGTLTDGWAALICCKDLGMEEKHLYERRELVLAASFGKEAIDGLYVAQE
jgi:hypothetical protein